MRVIDFHVHLVRSPELERTVFPKQGWPSEWYWANPARVGPYMDFQGISQKVTVNIMVTANMIERRLSKLRDEGATEAALREAEASLREEMKERVRVFNTWACEFLEAEPRVI